MGWKIGDKITVDPEDTDLVPIEKSGITRNTTWLKLKGFFVGTTELTTEDKTVTGAIEEVKGIVDRNTTQLSDMQQNVEQLSNPNLLINGDFQIWQRGTSFIPPIATQTYTADRWNIAINSATSLTVSKGSDGQLQIINLTAFTSNVRFGQFIEIPSSLRGKTVTLSISLSSTVTQNLIMFATSYDGTTILQPPISSKLISLNTNATVYTLTFTAPTTSYVYIGLTLACASSGYYGSTAPLTLSVCTINAYWAKLELGSKATTFMPRLYAEELALCLRYYEYIPFVSSFKTVLNGLFHSLQYVEKRIIPSVWTTAIGTGTKNKISAFTGTGYEEVDVIIDPINVKNARFGSAIFPNYINYDFNVVLDAEIY